MYVVKIVLLWSFVSLVTSRLFAADSIVVLNPRDPSRHIHIQRNPVRTHPANRGQNALPRRHYVRSQNTRTTPRISVGTASPVIISNPHVPKKPVVPNLPRNDFKPKEGEKWFEAAHRMWYEEKIMPKTENKCTLSRTAIDQMIADHIGVEGDVEITHHFHEDGDFWHAEHGQTTPRTGVDIKQVTTLTPKEVHEILVQECRTMLKVKQTSAKIDWVVNDDEINGAIVTIVSQGQ